MTNPIGDVGRSSAGYERDTSSIYRGFTVLPKALLSRLLQRSIKALVEFVCGVVERQREFTITCLNQI